MRKEIEKMSTLIRPDMSKEQIDSLEKTPFQFQDSFFGDGFTPFPKSIQLNPALSIQARFLYGILLSFAWEKKYCFPGIEQLKQIMNLSQPRINIYLNELEKAGVIFVETNLYVFREIPNTNYNKFSLDHALNQIKTSIKKRKEEKAE